MLNRTTLPPTSLTHKGAGMDEGRDRLVPVLNRERWRRLARVLQLPTTAQGYAVFASCLLILAFTMVLHITLSAEIMRMEVQVFELQQEHARIEQANANMIWRIAGHSALQDIDAYSNAQNYTDNVPVKYVVRPAINLADPWAPIPGPEAPTADDPLTEGRVLVMTPGQAQGEQAQESQAQPAGEPQVAGQPAPAPAQESAWQGRWAQAARIYENFQSWLRTLVPGQFQQTP
jgi:hypothetical protein